MPCDKCTCDDCSPKEMDEYELYEQLTDEQQYEVQKAVIEGTLRAYSNIVIKHGFTKEEDAKRLASLVWSIGEEIYPGYSGGEWAEQYVDYVQRGILKDGLLTPEK